jgi:hypothetical protein
MIDKTADCSRLERLVVGLITFHWGSSEVHVLVAGGAGVAISAKPGWTERFRNATVVIDIRTQAAMADLFS